MFEQDILYSHNSVVIAVTLFVVIMVANEAGFRYARILAKRSDDGIKSQTNAIQAGMLGLLALLLGFSFTMALQRFDSRGVAVVEESNAIGTAYLRAQLLPEAKSIQAKSLLKKYVDLRVESGTIDMTDNFTRKAYMDKTLGLQDQLWRTALEAAKEDPAPTTSGLFIQSLNDVIDAFAKRQAALQKPVPQVVLYLLFSIFIISGCVLGYASGLGGGRPWLATLSMAGLIVLVIFIVIDLDRPRRGLIQIDQSTLVELATSLRDVSDK